MSIHDFPVILSTMASQRNLEALVQAMRNSPDILTVSSGWSSIIPGHAVGNATIAVVLK